MPIPACSNCGEEISPKWIVCPICSHPASEKPAALPADDDDSSFSFAEILCIKCKKQIGPDTQICPHCHVPIIRRYCSGCQRLIPDHVNFCPHCHAEPSVKRGLGKFVKVALFIFLPSFLILAYFIFYQPDPPARTAVARGSVPEESEFAGSGPSEADYLPNEPAPELLADLPLPLAISPLDPEEMKPAPPAPLPSNTVVEVRREERPKVKPAVLQVAPDFASRGARLKQGRQLKELGSRLIRQKQYSKAVYVLQDAVRAFPTETKDLSYGEALYNLGYSLRMSGKAAEAIPVLKKALSFPFIRNKAAQELQSASDQMKKTQAVQWVKP